MIFGAAKLKMSKGLQMQRDERVNLADCVDVCMLNGFVHDLPIWQRTTQSIRQLKGYGHIRLIIHQTSLTVTYTREGGDAHY